MAISGHKIRGTGLGDNMVTMGQNGTQSLTAKSTSQVLN
jgi:hypothetical protein